jgi:ABC-type sugar transport system permease subunit
MRKLSLIQRRNLQGIWFILPWLIGFLILFLYPAIKSIQFAFNELVIQPNGFSLSFVAFANFKEALLVHPEFNRVLVESVVQMLVNVPLILFFSLFCATLVNQKFRGRSAVRAIFFLPVILASAAVVAADQGSMMNQLMVSATSSGGAEEAGYAESMISTRLLLELMYESGLNITIAQYLATSVAQIYDVISNSGIQILIFLAGLQSIPTSMYEVAKIEGSTGYQSFWKITFPMLSPLILTNIIYTVIDSFSNNQMTNIIYSTAFGTLNFGLSSSMVWMYTLVVGLLLLLIGYLVSKKVFYYE